MVEAGVVVVVVVQTVVVVEPPGTVLLVGPTVVGARVVVVRRGEVVVVDAIEVVVVPGGVAASRPGGPQWRWFRSPHPNPGFEDGSRPAGGPVRADTLATEGTVVLGAQGRERRSVAGAR